MRALILAATILGILASANAAKAGLSTTPRELASVDTATVSDEATLETEDQIGLTRITRREVQRRLTTLGFDTKVNGKFEESTRQIQLPGPLSKRGSCPPSSRRWRSNWRNRRRNRRIVPPVATDILPKSRAAAQSLAARVRW